MCIHTLCNIPHLGKFNNNHIIGKSWNEKKKSKKKRENKESFEILKIYICYKMESSKLIKYLSNMCGSYPWIFWSYCQWFNKWFCFIWFLCVCVCVFVCFWGSFRQLTWTWLLLHNNNNNCEMTIGISLDL